MEAVITVNGEIPTWYADNDGDGFGDDNDTQQSCEQPDGYVDQGGDCDDSDSTINPGATEIPNDGIDQNCDGQDQTVDSDGDGIDDNLDNCPDVANPGQEDLDGDGIGDVCDDDADGDGVPATEDCDDTDADIGGAITWYADTDNDGFGDDNDTQIACTQPDGYVNQGGDCNDSDNTIYPGAPEIPNDGIDQDCDGEDQVTAGLPVANAGEDQMVTDEDEDGFELIQLDGSLSTDSDGTIESYIWSLEDDFLASGANPSVNLPVGEYTITLTVEDNDGQTDTDEVVITVMGNVVSIDDDLNDPVQPGVYPNPTSSDITVELPANLPTSEAELRVLSIHGQELPGVSIQRQDQLIYRLDLAPLAEGMYILQVKAGSKSWNIRVVKE